MFEKKLQRRMGLRCSVDLLGSVLAGKLKEGEKVFLAAVAYELRHRRTWLETMPLIVEAVLLIGGAGFPAFGSAKLGASLPMLGAQLGLEVTRSFPVAGGMYELIEANIIAARRTDADAATRISLVTDIACLGKKLTASFVDRLALLRLVSLGPNSGQITTPEKKLRVAEKTPDECLTLSLLRTGEVARDSGWP